MMLTSSRLPQSSCGFASTRRPSSATGSPSLSSMPTAVDASHSSDTSPVHLLTSCCGGKTRLQHTMSSVDSSALNCSSAHSVHRNAQSSSSLAVVPVSLSTFRPKRNVDATCCWTSLPADDEVPPSSLSSVCCGEFQRSSTSFPPPPPPLPPSFVASFSTVDVAVSCSSPCLTSSQAVVTVVVGHHTPCVPPPPEVAPCLVPPPPPPPPLLLQGQRLGPPGSPSSPKLSSVGGRAPRTKLRRLQWHKIPDSRVRAVGTNCVWAHVQRQLNADSSAPCLVDLERVEELFAVTSSSSSGSHGMTRPKSGPATTTLDRRKSDQVELFDSRRSLNMGIFLRHFRASDQLVGCLLAGDSESVGAERLRALLKSLPDEDEMGKVLNYSGDPSRLGPAEKFCHDLAVALPNYRLRIEALLLKEEFHQTVDWLKPSIDAVIISARALRDCRAIRDILGTVLLVGNFLNAGAYTGGAAGFQLQSLLTLRELRANGGRLSLLHLIVTEVDKRNPRAINEISEMKCLKEAAQCHIETITGDFGALRDKLRRISSQISSTDNAFRQQMGSFIEFAGDELTELESDVSELECLRVELASYFCEDEKTFQLDDCIRLFSTFFDSFLRASQENQERRVLEEKAEERRKLRTQQMNAKQRSHSLQRKPVDSDNSAEARRLGSTKFQQPSSSMSATGDAVETGSEHKIDNTSTDNLGGHADVTGSSDLLPLRSVSSSGSLYTRMRNYPAEGGSGDNEGDLLDSLLRVASTTAGGGGSDSSGLALRRRRRSNATELETAGIRERTLSPVCVGVVNDLGQRMAVRRRSLPTPHLTVRDVAIATGTTTPLRCNDELSESSALSRLQTSGNITGDSTTVSARDDDCLSDIDENVATTTISAVSDVSRTTKNPKADSIVYSYNDDISSVDKSSVHDSSMKLNRETDGNTNNGQESVTDVQTSTRRRSQVDAVQPNTDSSKSSTNSELRQTQSTVDVDVTSSTCLPRRTQSLKLYRVRARSAARGEMESQQLDANVHEFQTRAAPEREALRNRLRKLSLVYAASTDADETSRTWPASRRPCADGDQGLASTTTAIPEIPLRCGDVVSASSSTSTLQLKYDTDSLSSQKDEGFETASISSDVYLSSSQRSSMCECDTTQERRTDPTTTSNTVENLPPPPASFLNGPELVKAETPRSSGENCFTRSTESLVLPRSEQESVELDVEDHPSVVTPLSVVNTEENRLSEASTESRGRRGVLSGINIASVRRPAQTVVTRQAKTTVVKPAPATPRRSSSLLASSTSRGSTRSATAVTNKQTAAVKPSIRPPSVNTASNSGLSAPFQRSSTSRTEDGRKLTSSGRTVPPQQAFVRQSQTRATIAAPVLRTNKRAAAESRRMKEAAASAAKAPSSTTYSSDSPPSRQTTPSNLAADRHRIRQRTSSSGSCSSTTSASARPKLASFRSTVGSETTRVSRHPTASVDVPCASSKKPDGGAATSTLSKTSSNLRRSTQPTNTRLRAPLITKKHCT